MFSGVEKEHIPGIEPGTFGYRVRGSTTGPRLLLSRVLSSLIIYHRMNNFKSKRILAYAFHSLVIYLLCKARMSVCHRVLRKPMFLRVEKDTHRGSNPEPLASESGALPLGHVSSYEQWVRV